MGESWEWEDVPAGRSVYVRVCVCLQAYRVCVDRQALCTAVAGRDGGGGCHFKRGPGQGNIAANTMNGRDTKRNKILNKKIKKGGGLEMHYWLGVPTRLVIRVYSHLTSTDDRPGSPRVTACLRMRATGRR